MSEPDTELVGVPLGVLLDLEARVQVCADSLYEAHAPGTAAITGALRDVVKKIGSILPEPGEPCTASCCADDDAPEPDAELDPPNQAETAQEPTMPNDGAVLTIEPEQTAAPATAHLPLDGLVVLITGNLPTMGRPQAHTIIEGLGGRPIASVSKATDLVVLGEGAGLSKMEKIRTFNHRVITGEDFEHLVEGRAEWTSPPGTPCRDWEDAQDEEAGVEPEPVNLTPFSERHLLAVAGLGMRGSGFDAYAHYRSLCIKCETVREGRREEVDSLCPNDPQLAQHDTAATVA